MIRCHACKIDKDIEQFYKSTITPNGKVGMCRDCKRKKGISGHHSWLAMKKRCLNANYIEAKYYSHKGIRICEGLQSSFKYFIDIIGVRPSPKHSIDRIDNIGNYTCGKCEDCSINGWKLNIRWATNTKQVWNRGNLKTNKSGYRGVSWKKAGQKWSADIGINRKKIHLGVFDTAIEASKAYEDAYLKREQGFISVS